MKQLVEQLKEKFEAQTVLQGFGDYTLLVNKADIYNICLQLRDEFEFDTLIDLCAVDYLTYGESEWDVEASNHGFSRGRKLQQPTNQHPERFAVVYNLLSVSQNYRLRVKTYVSETDLMIRSVIDIWTSSDWYEREAFDLFGILFENHPDLRRILTDYGFKGHPLRKDFPLIGEVEMRYDEELGRVAYEPVSIEENINVPRVIRK
jgi:NADH-quinone oxidoreductase subunit C